MSSWEGKTDPASFFKPTLLWEDCTPHPSRFELHTHTHTHTRRHYRPPERGKGKRRGAAARWRGCRRLPWRVRTGSRRVRWLNHYSSAQSILVVGDGEFSFSLALATAFGSGENIVATSLDSYEALTEKYDDAKSNVRKLKKMGAKVLHGISAKSMKHHSYLETRQFQRIIFNFPHAGFIEDESEPCMINSFIYPLPSEDRHLNHSMKLCCCIGSW
ncbi:heavy metal-associated isoprenylated plant protein 41 [Triticum aestivum]|uniref:heavy metal-associated isoprenylated plant protein 41 n=1 Tax=Triticum aestivum TaxID=4565 RepID=UPI001D00DCBE|nr:heavy metal-associated isoprenylated plant protein 41-like [Triticum aestivum]